ncbi:MAG: hypothetical protein KJO43_10060, partial [Phycisphaerae bacterium]|nr:hypothetical protein [Phycisphaerae bacterium]
MGRPRTTFVRHLFAAIAAVGMTSAAANAGCPADFDGSSDVGFNDLLSLLAAWGPCGGCPQDLDGSGDVGFVDLLSLLSAWGPCPGADPTPMLLAGESLAGYPHFHFVRSFNPADAPEIAIDPGALPLGGITADVYIVEARTAAQWGSDPSLVDARGGPQTETFSGATIQENTRTLTGTGALSTGSDMVVGAGYDIVVDRNQNGTLDASDLIDGLGDEPALFLMPDLTGLGDLTPTSVNYSGGTFLGQRTWYPDNIDDLGQLPLIVISHGNGHQYTWYDYAQKHLSSYGYIVMSHQNNTAPGIETASTTTLTNTDYLLANQATIAGGVLDGHIDASRIIWVGHSRGGEGVVRAYDRIFDGSFTPDQYTLDDIISVVSISPTDFLGFNSSNPHESNYHLIYGSSDGDVQGNPSGGGSKPFAIYERGEGTKHVTYLQGCGHNEFNCCGFADATGPDLIGRIDAQQVAKGYFLAIAEVYARGNAGALDYLQRMEDDLRPAGIPGDVIVVKEYRPQPGVDDLVIDDYQTQTGVTTSSSGGLVSFDVFNVTEGIMIDTDGSFVFSAGVPFNGMTRGKNGLDSARCVVFDWAPPGTFFYEHAITAGAQDLTGQSFLSFRACQGTRHPNTN